MAATLVVGVLVLASGGAHESTDRAHAKEVSAGIGVAAGVGCSGPACEVVWRERFHSAAEARLMALPVVAWVNIDPRLRSIDALEVRIDDQRARSLAKLSCSLPKVKSDQARPAIQTVADLASLCRERLVPSA